MWHIRNKSLFLNDMAILIQGGALEKCSSLEDGAFITLCADKAETENTYALGRIAELNRVMFCYRNGPDFMSVGFGSALSDIRSETLCLLAEKKNGRYVLLLPIFDGRSRAALQYSDGGLQAIGFTGNDSIKVSSGRLLYISEGENPYNMMESAAENLKAELGSFELRKNKPVPDFFHYLGWCTYNAFYFDVDEEKYLAVLREMKDNGVQLGMTLIDDGWLSTDDKNPIGARTLQEFNENRQKFKSGFNALSRIAKEKFGIRNFMVWHASMGYWAGCAIEKYASAPTYIHYPSALKKSAEDMNKQFPHFPVNPEKAYDFYNDFHTYLKSVGVDGVKIDVQYLIEGVESFVQGRNAAFDIYHAAKERSIAAHFDGNALNCMSCSNDMVYRMKSSNAIRTGADYHPDADNGYLIASNAFNAFWLYPIAYGDWDMFFSSKDDSYMEAIGRIAGGSPIYVSDELERHNYTLLKQLSLSDGRVLRPLEPGRPTLDCLMKSPMEDGSVLKVFNKNFCTYILGAFNFGYTDATFEYSPRDVFGVSDKAFISFGFFDGTIKKLALKEKAKLSLNGKSADLLTFSPIIKGVAIIGLKDKINRSAAVSAFECDEKSIYVSVVSNGEYELYCESKPERLVVNGEATFFNIKDNILEFTV